MPNTTIQLKKSATPSAIPSSLSNGELAINFADGKLYYKNVANYVVEYTSSQSFDFGTVSANGTLLVADTTGDVLTLAVGNNITIVGDAVNDKATIGVRDNPTFTGDVSGNRLISTNSINDEGGEIVLATALTNNSLSTSVTIDIFQNQLRFFETGGTNRGAFINLAIAGTGVSSNLLAGGGGTTDTVARDSATAARTVINDNLNATRYIMFANGTSGIANSLNISSGFTVNPSTNTVTILGNIELGAATDTTLSRSSAGVLAVEGVVVPTISSTNTLTNKRITPRAFVTAAQTSPLVWNSNNFDQYGITTLGNILTINADAGAPTDGQKFTFRFKPNTTGITLSWTTGSANSFRAAGVTLPTSLANGKLTYVGVIYNAADSRWDAIATVTEA